VVWVIPVLAAVVAVGIAIQRIASEGPTITIVFKAAEGLEAGKTFVKYKDVNIGQVTAVQLSPDYSRVEVTAKIAKSAGGLMVEDAKFWVVQPRVTLSGISGLGTLLSGNYIGFEAGKSAKAQRQFTGLEVPPIVTGAQPGRRFVLKAENLGSLGIGAPVYYRRLQAGQVIAYDLARDGAAVDITVFVDAPYDRYITSATRFWNASGVDVSVGAGGVDVRLQSLVALIAGGIAFDTPSYAGTAQLAAANTVFTLYNDQPTAMKQPDPISKRFVLYFTESLRGLSVGAPVTLLGLPGGEVTQVGLDFDPAVSRLRGRVEIVTYPERLVARLQAQQVAVGETLAQSAQQRQAFFQRLVEQRGMRAQLRSGSLLTGQLYVALDYFPNAPKAKIDWRRDPTEMPVVPSTITDLEAKLTGIIAKLDKLPYDAIGTDLANAIATLDQVLKDADKAVNRIDADVTPELQATLDEARRVIASADAVLKHGVNATLDAASTTLNQATATLEELRRPIATADAVLKNTEASLLGKNAPVQQELRDALQEIARAAHSLRVLTDYLERHPEALIRGKTEETP
jgi:paraquat-inducible protein B